MDKEYTAEVKFPGGSYKMPGIFLTRLFAESTCELWACNRRLEHLLHGIYFPDTYQIIVTERERTPLWSPR